MVIRSENKQKLIVAEDPPNPLKKSKAPKTSYRWGHNLVTIECKAGKDTSSASTLEKIVATFKSTSPYTTPPKEGKEPDPNEHIQASRYGMGPNSSLAPIRRFSIVLLIHGHHVRIQYIDRSSIFISRSCNFGEEPSVLIALIIAITECGSHALGFEKAFVEDDQYPCEVGELVVNGLSYPKGEEDDDKLIAAEDVTKLPQYVAPEPSSSPVETGEDTDMSTSVPSEASAEASFELVDIVTSPTNLAAKSLPVKLNKNGTVPKEPEALPPRSLTGRGTSVYRAKAKTTDAQGVVTVVDCVVKFSWHPVGRVSEARVIRIANKKGVRNTVELLASGVLGQLSEDDSTRSRFFEECFWWLHQKLDDRKLHITVMRPYCRPLVKVLCLKTSLTAFLSLIKGEFVI